MLQPLLRGHLRFFESLDPRDYAKSHYSLVQLSRSAQTYGRHHGWWHEALGRHPQLTADMPLGRNDPCDCGSGKKYKQCCGAVLVAIGTDPKVARADRVKLADKSLDEHLHRFSRKRGGADWLDFAMVAFSGDTDAEVDPLDFEIAMPWALYHFPFPDDVVPIAQVMRNEQAWRLSPEVRDVLDAQLNAWLSVWEAVEVEPGVGIKLKDLLTGEERFVYESLGSQDVMMHHNVLARVVDCDGISFFGGLYPQALPPLVADLAVREMRRACRVRTRSVKPEKLRDPELQLELLDLWKVAVEEAYEQEAMPELANTDGDPLALTTDLFVFDAADRNRVTERLAQLAGASEPLHHNGGTEIVMTKGAQSRSVIGRLLIKGTRLKSEAMSTNRADDLREMIERELETLVRHRLREEGNSEALLESARANSAQGRWASPVEASPEIKAMMREIKEAHMLGWVDEQLPALGGLTPREAAASPRSRKALDLLLRDFEYHEATLPVGERFDMGRVRTILGMIEAR